MFFIFVNLMQVLKLPLLYIKHSNYDCFKIKYSFVRSTCALLRLLCLKLFFICNVNYCMFEIY
jgi:hypothetical protein